MPFGSGFAGSEGSLTVEMTWYTQMRPDQAPNPNWSGGPESEVVRGLGSKQMPIGFEGPSRAVNGASGSHPIRGGETSRMVWRIRSSFYCLLLSNSSNLRNICSMFPRFLKKQIRGIVVQKHGGFGWTLRESRDCDFCYV